MYFRRHCRTMLVRKLNGSRHPAIYINDLAYADDICLLAESFDGVECSLHRIETSAADIGLTINLNKTKAMHLGQISVRHVRFANGDPVDSCDKLLYLWVPTYNAKTVFRSRLSKAWAAATKFRPIDNSKANYAIKIGLSISCRIRTVVRTRMSSVVFDCSGQTWLSIQTYSPLCSRGSLPWLHIKRRVD